MKQYSRVLFSCLSFLLTANYSLALPSSASPTGISTEESISSCTPNANPIPRPIPRPDCAKQCPDGVTVKCVAIMPGGCAQSAPACTVGCVIYLKNDRCLSLGLGSGSENHFSNDDFRRRFSCASTSSADQLKNCCLMQHEHFHACTENKGPRICEESGAFELEAACLKNGISASCGGVKTTWPKEQCGESCKDLFRRLMLASWTKCLCGVATSCSTSPTKEECCACQKMCSSPESILNALPAVCKSVPGIADNYANNCQGLVNSNHGCSMIGVSGQINCGGKITVGTDPLLEY